MINDSLLFTHVAKIRYWFCHIFRVEVGINHYHLDVDGIEEFIYEAIVFATLWFHTSIDLYNHGHNFITAKIALDFLQLQKLPFTRAIAFSQAHSVRHLLVNTTIDDFAIFDELIVALLDL